MNQNFLSKNWSAWHNLMPGSEPALHVTGEVTCPTSGYTARLSPSSPQGINPATYLMDLIVTPPAPGTLVLEVVTDVPLHYQELTSERYTDVTILPENTTISVKLVF